MKLLLPQRITEPTTSARWSASTRPPCMYLFSIQNLMALSRAAGSQFLLNSVWESPVPPKLSPTASRVNPILGCSMRHASTSLSRAAFVTAYEPSSGHGVVNDALSDDR